MTSIYPSTVQQTVITCLDDAIWTEENKRTHYKQKMKERIQEFNLPAFYSLVLAI